MSLEEYLHNHYRRLFQDEPQEQLQLAKIGHRSLGLPSDLVYFVIFVNRETAPRYFLKVDKNKSYSDHLKSEFLNHKFVYDNVDRCKESLCRPIFYDEGWHCSILCTEYRKFKRVDFSNRAEIEQWLDLAVSWLVTFVSETSKGHGTVDIGDMVDENLKWYTLLTNEPNEKDPYRDKLHDFAREKSQEEVAGCIMHGDYNHHNVYLNKDLIVVVDWGDSALDADPFHDIMYLLLNSLIALSDVTNLKELDLEKLYQNHPFASSLVDRACRTYSSRIGTDLETLHIMIALTAMNMRFNDHRDTLYCRRACPLYIDSLLVSFRNLFLAKAFRAWSFL